MLLTDEQGNKHFYMCIDDTYKIPNSKDEWLPCPNCGEKPVVWEYDNGRFTACGCGESVYDHFSIRAESVMSVYTRCDGNTSEYDCDGLRKNWNHWVKTGEKLFDPKYEKDGLW